MGLFWTRKKPRVLYVDDMDAAHRPVQVILEHLGIDMLQAYNGEEAVAAAEKDKPDLILMDAEMPVLDGFEACTLLKRNPKTKHIPVIMCTGFSGMEDVNKATMAGADGYVIKPITEDRLKAKLSQFIPIK